MNKLSFLARAFALALLPLAALAQTGGVTIGANAAPDPKAVLDVRSTTQGLLPPRMSQAQRDAIQPGTTAAGLTIYNTTTNKLNTWNGTSWDAALSATEQPLSNPVVSFAYLAPGGEQLYTVPVGVHSLAVDAAGAQGGTGGGPGGLGGRVTTTLAVTPGEVLRIYVGGAGGRAPQMGSGGAGYNGGAEGRQFNGGGGGGTDIRRGGAALTDRVVVAGGGGGATSVGYGGDGGGLVGGNAGGGINGSDYPGLGGSQSAGGAGGTSSTGTSAGSLGQGGIGNYTGGGGGYYGGGGGGGSSGSTGGGGGGSSYVTPTGSSNTTHTPAYRAGNGVLTLTPAPAYAAPALDATNFINTPWTRGGAALYPTTLTNNVGIGTATPSQKLDVNGSANVSGNSTVGGNVGIGTPAPLSRLSIQQVTAVSNTAGQNLGELSFVGVNRARPSASVQALTKDYDDTGHLLFKTSPDGNGAVERLRITADGQVGLGTSTPTQKLDVDGGILARSSGLVSNQGAYLHWNRSGTEGETWLLNQNGLGTGGIRFGQSNAVSTGPNAVAEWARFDGSGNLGLGTTTPDARLDIESGAQQQLILTSTSTDPTGVLTLNFPATNSAGPTSSELVVFNKAGTGTIGQIVANLNTNTVSYATASDQRMKEHIGATRYGLADLLRLRVKDYNFIGTTQRTTGLLAQELFRVYPDAVKEGDHGPTLTTAWAVDYGKLTPLLVQAVQDQQRIIEQQQAEIQALQARAATTEAKAAADKAAATATLETFEARLRRLEAATAGQASK